MKLTYLEASFQDFTPLIPNVQPLRGALMRTSVRGTFFVCAVVSFVVTFLL